MIDEAVAKAIKSTAASLTTKGKDEKSNAGKDGRDGKDGVGIAAVTVDNNGDLIVAFTNGVITDVGHVKGEKGDVGSQGPKGDSGTSGSDGVSPHIGANGNWFIGDQDTNIPASGGDSASDFLFNDGGNGTELIAYNGSANNVVIPSKCTKICHNAFKNTLSYTKSIAMSDNVTEIEHDAFYGMVELESIKLSNNLTTIGNNAFYNCKKLEAITIPAGVSEIQNYAFWQCNALTSVSLKSGLKVIGNGAFSDCNMTSIDIPNTVTTIGSTAFSGCGNLSSVNIPEGVTSVGSGAFFGTKISSIVIPSTVTSIGSFLFVDDNYIDTVTINAATPPTVLPMSTGLGYVYDIFYTTLPKKIKVPAASIDLYKNAQYWDAYSSLYEPI